MIIKIEPYKKYEETEVLALYQAVGWSNYFTKPAMLRQAFAHSLYTLAAYANEQLVGLIRIVGDGHSIIYIQDILVHPDFQRQGIGRQLFQQTLANYAHVYQTVLMTDDTEKTRAFYQSLGFQDLGEMKGLCFVQYNK